jgi:choline kinase
MVTRIGKDVSPRNAYGESIGIEMFSESAIPVLFEELERRIRQGGGKTEFYESAFQVLIDRGLPMRAVNIGRLPAMEIDTPDDYRRACTSIAPLLDHD